MNILQLIILLASIETGGHRDPNNAIGDHGRAVGRLQIHPVMVQEVNRLLGYNRFSLADRRDTVSSYAMAVVFLRRQRERYAKRYGHDPSAAELMASWNSGSIFTPCTMDYRRKIKQALNTEE